MTETGLRNERHLSMDDLVKRINDGDIDTVVVAFTDMQGRLQGKRLHGRYFADVVVDHGTEGLQLPARGRRGHEHRRRLLDLLLGARVRRHGVRARRAGPSGC